MVKERKTPIVKHKKIVNRIVEPKEKKKKEKPVKPKPVRPPKPPKKEPWRPPEYTENHVTIAREYLSICKDEERKRVKSESSSIGGESTSWDYGVKIRLPSIEGLARYFHFKGMHIARSTIYKWKDEKGKENFSDILEEILSEQANRLLENGLNGDYNPTIAKLILTKHGYSDKTENDTTIKGSLTLADGLINLTRGEQKKEI